MKKNLKEFQEEILQAFSKLLIKESLEELVKELSNYIQDELSGNSRKIFVTRSGRITKQNKVYSTLRIHQTFFWKNPMECLEKCSQEIMVEF